MVPDPPGRDYTLFPLWITLSGLPTHLNDIAKAPYCWAVFRAIVEIDIAHHPAAPGLVEIPLSDLARQTGLDPKKLEKAVKGMRKAGVLRAFLPDSEEEEALFQVITPLATPMSPDEVRAGNGDAFLEAEWPPRYATATLEEPATEEAGGRLAKTQRVVELYLNVFSMKLNSLTVDQLQIIADRYDEELIRRVFERARQREARSLGWILAEIRREQALRHKAAEIRRGEGHDQSV